MSTKKTDKTSDNKPSSEETVTIPTSQEEAGQFRQAYEETADERNALGEDQLVHINVDIPTAVNIVLGNLPNIEALADEARALPTFDMRSITKLGKYAEALAYSQMLFVAASEPVENVPGLASALAGERAKLLASAEALAARGYIDGSRFGDLKGGPGYKNIAYDVGTLVAMLRAAWPKIDGKTAVTQPELAYAQAQTETLLLAIAAREQRHIDQATAGQQRARAYTLLVNAYDQVQRAIVFLRWRKPVEDIAPSLFAHPGKKHPEDATADTKTGDKPAATAEKPVNGAAKPAPSTTGAAAAQ